MPGGLSIKLVAVLAALAFAIAFRVQAGSDDSPARTATLSPSRASALASDTTVQEAPRGIAAPALARVAALPALHRAPARPKRAVSTPAPVATVAPVATATATVVPSTPVVTTKPAAPKKKSYVGKSFDTKG